LRRNTKNFFIEFIYGNSIIQSKSKLVEINKTKKTIIETQLSAPIKAFRNAIYIPPSEILTTYNNYLDFESINKLSKDSTYYYLANLLIKERVKSPELEEISNELKKHIGFEIQKDDLGFFQKIKNKKIYAPLMADGLKKLCTLKYLIDNNSLNKKSILIIDEPEVHLNPILISKLVEFLFKLSEKGVQIFLSTHDYLLSYLLSLKPEYCEKSNIKFFSLYESTNGITYESANDLTEIKINSINNEYEKLIEIENKYFFENK